MPGTDEPSGNEASSYWTPRPDPTKLTDAAIERATSVFQREIAALQTLHDKDLAALRELLAARLEAMDQDRTRLWERNHELTGGFETALTQFRAEVERRDTAGRQLIEQRLDDLDDARHLAARQIDAVPAQYTARISAEREYVLAQLEIIATRMTEKFAAIDEQFSASKTAVDAALSAAKEAVAEQNKANSAAIKVSEGNTKEQLTSLGQVSSANFNALEDKITDARDRLTTIESLTRGIKEAGTDSHYGQTFDQTARIAATSQQRATLSTVIAGISILVAVVAVIIPLILKQ